MYKYHAYIVHFILFFLVTSIYGKEEENVFSEELLIKPLTSGHIYSHFEFTTVWQTKSLDSSIRSYDDYVFTSYDYFPRALGEIVEKYHVRELHLTLTQGLWRHQKWGYPIYETPPGAQLFAWFNPGHKNLDQTWKDLVNALSGLFCASLNFIDQTNTVSPALSFRPLGLAEEWYSSNSSYMRYATLPRENVCTENLTPWKKLLPCDTKSGLATLLHPTPLYSAHYHSLAIHLRPSCQDKACKKPQLELVQSLSLVQKFLHEMEGKQDWTIRKLFSSPVNSVCALSSNSKIYVDVSENEDNNSFSLIPEPTSIEKYSSGAAKRSYAIYDLFKLTDDSFNLQARYKKKHIYGYIPRPPLEVSRFITGHGQESGSITVKLQNNEPEPLSVIYLEVLPWYLRLFFHSSHTAHLENSMNVSKLVTARDRERGWLYEVVVKIPAKSSTELKLEFHRALLKWLEYPPDANHGFYLPAAIVSTVLPTARNVSYNRIQAVGLMEKLQLSDGPSFIRIATETLLVSLPTPDFSMPYNVICLSCTVVALAFGPIHNITTTRLTVKKLQSKPFILVRVVKYLLNFFSKSKSEVSKEVTSESSHTEDNELVTECDVSIKKRPNIHDR